MKYKIIFFLLFIMNQAFSQTSEKEIITNDIVIQMYNARISRALILSKIQYSICSFDLSANGLIALKRAKVPDDIVKIMFTRGTSEQKELSTSKTNSIKQSIQNSEITNIPIPVITKPLATISINIINSLESGIYYYSHSAKGWQELEPSVLSNIKSGGLGEVLKRNMISPLINAKKRASLSGIQANVIIETTTPQFIFAFEKNQSKGINNSSSFFSSVQSPNEFMLVKMNAVKASREVVVGLSNSVSDNNGIDDKIKIPFKSKKLANGRYEVTLETNLLPGEYCFMFASSSINQGMTHKVYDFSIR